MNKPTIRYFETEDILHLVISEESESRSLELGSDITVELNEQNELIGVEILNASNFLREAVLDVIEERAEENGRSLQAELKMIPEQAVRTMMSDSCALAAKIRHSLGNRLHFDGAVLLAEDRIR
jgi:uncharacterized protein YuzE